jgi:hypothetical protein
LDVSYTDGIIKKSNIIEIPVGDTVEALKHRALEEFECGFIGDHFGIIRDGTTLRGA